jgi:hypothetical protein
MFYKQKILFFIFFLLFLFFSCKTNKTPGGNNSSNSSSTSIDPTKFTITDNTKEDELNKHIRALFNYIEDRIIKGDYESWYNSISQKYKDYINDPENLRALTEKSDFLFNRNFNLKDAKDYFKYVVMLSREGKSLVFVSYKYINKNHIKVFCLFDKKDELVYDFVYEDGSWKVDR